MREAWTSRESKAPSRSPCSWPGGLPPGRPHLEEYTPTSPGMPHTHTHTWHSSTNSHTGTHSHNTHPTHIPDTQTHTYSLTHTHTHTHTHTPRTTHTQEFYDAEISLAMSSSLGLRILSNLYEAHGLRTSDASIQKSIIGSSGKSNLWLEDASLLSGDIALME